MRWHGRGVSCPAADRDALAQAKPIATVVSPRFLASSDASRRRSARRGRSLGPCAFEARARSSSALPVEVPSVAAGIGCAVRARPSCAVRSFIEPIVRAALSAFARVVVRRAAPRRRSPAQPRRDRARIDFVVRVVRSSKRRRESCADGRHEDDDEDSNEHGVRRPSPSSAYSDDGPRLVRRRRIGRRRSARRQHVCSIFAEVEACHGPRRRLLDERSLAQGVEPSPLFRDGVAHDESSHAATSFLDVRFFVACATDAARLRTSPCPSCVHGARVPCPA